MVRYVELPLEVPESPEENDYGTHDAPSRLLVRLPAPGNAFSALVGVDSTLHTRGGRGSIVFGVTIAEKVVFRSKILREGMPAERVDINLGAATEFLLEVGDAGDGIACDQAAWADAKITLADGQIRWLGDLPIIGKEEAPAISPDPPFSFTYDGRPSTALLGQWRVARQVKELDAQRTERTITWTGPETKLVLRCAAIEYQSADLRLYGLDPEARYRVRNLDSPEADLISGRQLMETGLPVVLNDRPSAMLIQYERVTP